MNVLVIDVGGTNVKLHGTGWPESRKFESGPELTPEELIERVRPHMADSKFEGISLGYPGEVLRVAPREEPGNLGNGWVGFDYAAAFGIPVRLINDAAMQALGGYTGGKMLFLGLGTGLGSAFVSDRIVMPLELGRLRSKRDGPTLADRLSKAGLKRLGKSRWRQQVVQAATFLREAFAADYVLLGGGNAAKVGALPEDIRRGGNDDAFTGGYRLWDEAVDLHHSHTLVWRVAN